MAWQTGTVYLEGLSLFSSVVERFPSEGWQRPSPCAKWRALDVLGHVGAATGYGIDLLSGGAPGWKPADPPGDAVVGDPAAWWRDLADRARRLTKDVDLDREVDTPAGRRRVGEGLTFPAVDLFVHGWDLARSGDLEVEIPAEAVEFAHAALDPLPEAQLRSPAVFAPAVTPPPGAGLTDTFIAWTGRDPRRQPA